MNVEITNQPAQFYFAYGSNMSSEVFVNRRGMAPLSTHNAVLQDYALAFDEEGIRFLEPCFASVKPQPGAVVHGILYELAADDAERLHTTEGASYRIVDVVVTTATGEEQPCFTYVSGNPCPGRKPSRRYMNILINGAEEHGLPGAYVQMLREVDTFHIPLISPLFGLVIKQLTIYMARGKTLNIPFVKLGADREEDAEEKI